MDVKFLKRLIKTEQGLEFSFPDIKYLVKPWNYNKNKNNMQENPLLHMRFSLQLVYC